MTHNDGLVVGSFVSCSFSWGCIGGELVDGIVCFKDLEKNRGIYATTIIQCVATTPAEEGRRFLESTLLRNHASKLWERPVAFLP